LGQAGSWGAAAIVAIAAAVGCWLAGRRRERERQRLRTAEEEVRTRRRVDEAVRQYRGGGGAAGSLHDGRF
ncbi:MAG: hypothetical protein ACK5PI_00545, partial [Acetobacteraceae bacterium]